MNLKKQNSGIRDETETSEDGEASPRVQIEQMSTRYGVPPMNGFSNLNNTASTIQNHLQAASSVSPNFDYFDITELSTNKQKPQNH